jgi:hypothetical protein
VFIRGESDNGSPLFIASQNSKSSRRCPKNKRQPTVEELKAELERAEETVTPTEE